MVAVTESKVLAFRNVCGALKLQLKGTSKIKNITITGNNNERLSGAANVTAYVDGSRPKVEMQSEASNSVSLDCGNGVQLNASVATEFLISIPPTEFTKGFTITLTDVNGANMSLQTPKSNRVGRSSILNMPEVTQGQNFVFDSGVIRDDNMIVVSCDLGNGTYTLKYEDASKNALANYVEIGTVNVIGADGAYPYFTEYNIPPAGSSSIGVYDGATRVGNIGISGFKPSFGTVSYKFGLLSDVHYNEVNTPPTMFADDFANALSVFNSENVALTVICGDITNDGKADHLAQYKEAIKGSYAPVYTTTGNHDCSYGDVINEAQWKQYTGQDLFFEVAQTRSDGKTDHFLFLGMHYYGGNAKLNEEIMEETGGDENEGSYRPYKHEDIARLAAKLEEYKNERCFVITHLFFPDRAGNVNRLYETTSGYTSQVFRGPQLERLEALCDKYVNTVWFSGHSHWKWELQMHQDNANVYRKYNNDGTPASGWCVHVPACSKPRDILNGAMKSQPAESEGGIVDVYGDYIDIRGLLFKGPDDENYTNRYLPIATYRLDTTIYPVN
jgi:hypothetical protein